KKTVGYVPAIIGKKLKAHYFYDPHLNYFELDVDIASSTSFNLVIGMVMKSSQSLIVDTSLILQGETSGELPESVLGCGSLHRANLSKALKFEDHVPAPLENENL